MCTELYVTRVEVTSI